MTQQGDAVAGELATEKVGIKGYLAFFLTIFSLRWSWHRQSFSLWGLFQLPMVLADYAPRSS